MAAAGGATAGAPDAEGLGAGEVGTARLVLHPLTVDEAERVVAGEPGPGDRWAPGYPDTFDVKGVGSYLATCSISGDPTPFGTYEIRRRSDGRAIGGLGLHGPPDHEDTVTVGYSVIASEQGNGYATEALRGLLAHLRTLGVRGVRGDTDLDNAASQRVMAAAGMRQVAEDDRLRYYALRF
ncbi:GNAT family N-acetyltransferase [Streptomyces sp. 8L]|uniref:GNAT family N-acetyltransferase n=1 Tax=Streptomyces sp. 8L TaxID=2877242 RepID=UPI001CD524CE|nr:GNAT family N-acetyltransferase [Streptomyces sp. 8L]MCA1221470.1 GNAT family N-acetyltransferase [Streptomyces sp. 8L]